MIATRKDLFFFIEMTMLTLVALGYGFSLIPSPMEQQTLRQDHQRIVDLGNIRYAIDTYYAEHQQLPTSLDFLKARGTSYTGSAIKFSDPETNKPYAYTLTSPTTYRLCATFTTDNNSMPENKDFDAQNYEYATYRNEFIHTKGNVCFEEAVQEISSDGGGGSGGASSSSFKMIPSPTIACLGGGCPQITPTQPANEIPTPTAAFAPTAPPSHLTPMNLPQ